MSKENPNYDIEMAPSEDGPDPAPQPSGPQVFDAEKLSNASFRMPGNETLVNKNNSEGSNDHEINLQNDIEMSDIVKNDKPPIVHENNERMPFNNGDAGPPKFGGPLLR